MQVNPLVSSTAKVSMFSKTIGMQKILLLKQTVSGITEYLDIHIYYFYHYQTVRKLVVFCTGVLSLLNKL